MLMCQEEVGEKKGDFCPIGNDGGPLSSRLIPQGYSKDIDSGTYGYSPSHFCRGCNFFFKYFYM